MIGGDDTCFGLMVSIEVRNLSSSVVICRGLNFGGSSIIPTKYSP